MPSLLSVRLIRLGLGLLAVDLLTNGYQRVDSPGIPLTIRQAVVQGGFQAEGRVPYNSVFAPDGSRPETSAPRFSNAAPKRYWSSWNGQDNATGLVRLGSFVAPAGLEVPVIGYPAAPGNALYLEEDLTHERLPIVHSNVGSRWAWVRLSLPQAWVGKSVHLVAMDGSAGGYGWLAVGAPASVSRLACLWTPFTRILHLVCMAGGLLWACWEAGLRLIGRRLPQPARPMAALILVSIAAYGDFWLFLASPLAGWIGTLLLLGSAAWIASGPAPEGATESRLPAKLMVPIALAYLGITFLYPTERPVFDVIARRYCQALAVDNQLPTMLAVPLLGGENPKILAYGWWHSSERPPLETGFVLLLGGPLHLLGADLEDAGQAVGLWLQLAWVGGLLAWLLSAGASRFRAAALIALVAASGFLLLNTVYVWPKLLAAGFAVAAVAMWGFMDYSAAVWAVGAGSFALAYLSHSGIAFSLIGLVPFAWVLRRKATMRGWVAAMGLFLLLVLPWSAYQKFYDPPGDYLLKFHLGGAVPRDGRSLGEVLKTAYGHVPASTLLHARISNILIQFRGPWKQWLWPTRASAFDDRQAEFYGLFYSMGWWNFGLLAWITLAFGRTTPHSAQRRAILFGGLWVLSTIAVWILLMYLPESAIVHQGSYACPLILMASLAWALQAVRPWLFWLVGTVNGVLFLINWLPPAPVEAPSPQALPALAIVLGASALAWVVYRAGRSAAAPRPSQA